MIICSFDIGIRNLAYCILNDARRFSGNRFNIIDWNLIDLFADTPNKGLEYNCQEICKNNSVCKSVASFYNNKFLCKRHSKTGDMKIFTTDSCNIADLAFLIIKYLNNIDFSVCDEFIIEQQPKMAKEKMKNVSIIILNYFVTRYQINNPKIKISMINASNKLSIYDGPFVSCTLKGQHERNKFYGKKYCEWLIRHDKNSLTTYNKYSKKDDLADCFLQGAWYLMTYDKEEREERDEKEEIDEKEEKEESIEKGDKEESIDKEEGNIGDKKIKFVFNFKKNDMNTDQIKNLESNKQIMAENSLYKYKRIQKLYKPNGGNGGNGKYKGYNYSLNNVKYLIEKKGVKEIDTDVKLQKSIEYFFGNKDTFLNFISQ